MIQSFSYNIAPHVPLRPAMSSSSASTVSQGPPAEGFGGDMMGQQRQGSTQILTILTEGTHVNEGDLVCTLDSAAFRDELQAQLIRFAQAKSWVEQAEKILEVNEISLKEYREGIMPQDRMLCQQYIASCETDLERSQLEVDWGQNAYEKGLQTFSQLKASKARLERSEIALREAHGMQNRLEKFTAPRLIANLEAKIAAIRADLLAQQSALELERERVKRLERNITACELRAPKNGIVVYENESNGWGQSEAQIQEGATVREGQPIFSVPDPTQMLVKARVNESKVGLIKTGMRASLQVDAFPDELLFGTVGEVTPIPAPAEGLISDVKNYFAIVRIDGASMSGLRPGMTAEVRFLIDLKRDVVRIPVDSIRRVGSATFVALPAKNGFRWQPVELGLGNSAVVEVRSGLQAGDKLIADPSALSAPDPALLVPGKLTAASIKPSRGS